MEVLAKPLMDKCHSGLQSLEVRGLVGLGFRVAKIWDMWFAGLGFAGRY